MRAYCKYEGRTLDIKEAPCELSDPWDEEEFECMETCDIHKSAEERKKRLEEFKSSEFAADILKRASAHFVLSEDEAVSHLDKAFKGMEAMCESLVKDLVGDAVATHITRYFDKQVTKMLDEMFKKAVEAQMLQICKDDTAVLTTIRKRAEDKVAEFFAKETGGARFNDKFSIDKSIEMIVDDKVGKALKELKQESIEKFEKEVMKKMMSGMAKAINDDKRLLAVIGD